MCLWLSTSTIEVHSTALNSSDNLPSYTPITAQKMSIGGEGKQSKSNKDTFVSLKVARMNTAFTLWVKHRWTSQWRQWQHCTQSSWMMLSAVTTNIIAQCDTLTVWNETDNINTAQHHCDYFFGFGMGIYMVQHNSKVCTSGILLYTFFYLTKTPNASSNKLSSLTSSCQRP